MKKFFSFSLSSFLFYIGIALAVVITVTATGYGYVTAPETIDFGSVQLGQIYEKPLFNVVNLSTGFNISVTIDEIMGDAKYWIKSPPNSAIPKHKMQDNETYTITLDDTTGEWKLEIQTLSVGEIKADIYLEYNQSLGIINQTG